MGCCGQQRNALAQSQTAGQLKTMQHIPIEQGPYTKIEFKHRTAILIRGPITGRHYQFHEGAYTQRVDARDAVSLIRSGHFQPA